MLISQGGLRSRPTYRLALQILLWASCPHLYWMSIWPLLLLTTPLWLTTLAVVLEALSKAPFEPLEEVPLRFLTVKTVFILAISSLKRVGDLQALSVSPSCLAFVPRMARAFLSPRCPQLFQGQSFCRHSVHIPFGMLTRKSLTVLYVFFYARYLPLWLLSGSTFLTLRPFLALQFSLPKLCHSTLDRKFVSMVAWAVSFPMCLPT